MVKPHVTVQQERFDGKWQDLDRLPLEVSGGLDRGVRRDHHRPAAEVVAVDDVVVDIPGDHVMKLVRVEIAEIRLGEPRVGLHPEPMRSALGDGSAIVERGDAPDSQALFGEKAFHENRILTEVTGRPRRVAPWPGAASGRRSWTRRNFEVSCLVLATTRRGRVGEILLNAADEVERSVERLVILRVRRDVGLRAGFLLAVALEVAAQQGFAARVGTSL